MSLAKSKCFNTSQTKKNETSNASHIFDHNPPDAAWPHRADEPNFPLPIRCRWTGVEFDGFWLRRLREMTDAIRAVALDEGCTTKDAPVYFNLSLDDLKVEDIYRENLPLLEKVRKQIDPENVMGRTGGFRIRDQ